MILTAEDDFLIAVSYRLAPEDAGYETVLAASAADAFRAIAAFSLAVVDLKLTD